MKGQIDLITCEDVGKYVNLEYQLPNGQKVKFPDAQKTYLGNL